MGMLTIVLVVVFSAILCVVEIPNMWKNQLYKELVAFSIILCCGVVMVVMESLNIPIPNPAQIVAVVYSPIANLIRSALE